MKQKSWIVLRPVTFFLFLIVAVLSLAALLITLWFNKVEKIEKDVKFIVHNFNQDFFTVIQNATALFSPNNASAINLARILSSSLDNNDLQFPEIESKVVPALFQACSTIPYLSQISYIGLNGMSFAYYKEGGGSYAALYSNTTFPSRNDTESYTWYKQTADRGTGKLYGEAVKFPAPPVLEANWFQVALNSSNGHASVGKGWKNPQEFLLLSSVGLNRNGVISLGFSMKPLIDFLAAEMALCDGSLRLASTDWNVVVRGFPKATSRTVLDGDEALFQTAGNISCQSYNGKVLSIGVRKYVVSCSPAEIAGLEFVYVFAVARDEYSSLVHKNIRVPFVLLVLMVGGVVVTVCVFVSLIVEAARREMFLRGALINQMESTQQSERKSMNKSLAFASASHDIRASLAGITGLIEVCRGEVTKRDPSRSDVVANLKQMEGCTRDLLGILNCILDTSKIEAGKMQLEEEEFDVEELLEDVVDLYHPVGMKKGVDVILDPCDGSVSVYSRARGDRSKLKQILSNLLSNAVKFTSEGHVTVRAWSRKPSLKNEMLASTQNKSMSCLLCLLFKIHRANNEAESVQRDPNCMDFTFEVNDTGRGIPKEKRKSVFENYIQLKETAFGQQGTGLGLGIVQSLVRLMGGEIEIVEKEVGEGGTCFRFNVLLSASEAAGARAAHSHFGANGESDSFQQPGLFTRVHSPRAERSQVVLLVKSAKRSKVLHTFMHKHGIKVHVVRQHEQLAPTLKQIKQKTSGLSSHSSEGNSRSDGSVPLSSLDGIDDVSTSHQKRPNAEAGLSGFILLVIDTRSGPFRGMSRDVAEFRRGLNDNCYSRVVWLDTPGNDLDEDMIPPSDLVMSKPLHGSRLHQTIALLPEFGGVPPRRGGVSLPSAPRQNVAAHGKSEIEEVGRPKPLMGKRILVVDDDPIGRKIATVVASELGAASLGCKNGAAALQLVCRSLEGEPSDSAHFDLILMDCEMPVMDGTEATMRIREAERGHGVRTPIFALTAHDKGEEIDKMIRAGVDGYMTKPLNREYFLNYVSQFIN